MKGVITYNNERADQDGRRNGISTVNLRNKVGHHADDGHQRDELHGAHGGEGVPEGAETRSGTHSVVSVVLLPGGEVAGQGDGCDEGELRARCVEVERRADGEFPGREGDAGGWGRREGG